ncbi:MAG: BMC domain-containing protein [Deltaproteobacteria bacterium]|nr:BMC domain-containing protein [Deltaproteobacteria bacterium]
MHEALGLLELSRVSRGYVVADAVAKKAPVLLVRASPITPGKFLVLFIGDVASVDEAMRAGTMAASDTLVDSVFLAQVHAAIPPALEHAPHAAAIQSLAIVETLSVASTILACDAALKAANVTLITMQLARGLGGKGYFVLTGTLYDIEAADAAATQAIDSGLLAGHEVIAAPHDDLVESLRHPALQRP